ncbi:MAG TPA: GlsB/YeaQ/YmgE family stress response membrane protein [Candidatus Saccharimonadales bacterium]|nr:GlsB/YeaQ/YmgE family stress response membrane protein [Candidatus Saccharimonadales bacterium]
MNILTWILFGLLVGTIANAIDTTPNNGGFIGSVLLGIVGALVGGFIANLLFGISITGFDTTAFIVAIAGSLLLLFFGKAIRRAS